MAKQADRDIIVLLQQIVGSVGGGSGATIPHTTNVIAGDGAGNGANTGVAIGDLALKTVASKYRIKTDGTVQIFNPDTGLYHTISLSGAAGAVTMDFAVGEA